MDQRSKGTKIDSFAIHFHLGKDSAPQIDQWISCAMIMGVETIDLDLSESCSSMVDHVSSNASDEYKFPFRILAVAGKKCGLRHLRLASCSLIAPPDSNSLTSLITIQLQCIDIKDEQLGILLSSCLFLEGLSLHLCNDLVNLKFAGPNLPLKDLNMLKLPETVPTFTNIKQLVLTIFPFDDEDKLCWISYVLKAFPLLQKLQLNLFCPSFIKQPKEIERVLPECPHSHVGELEINGFYGNQHEEELLKYLLDNLVELKVLAVSPCSQSCQKVYRGFNNWVYEEANAWYKFRMERVCGWLHAVVPPTVHLRIR
ncbi:hypothetical protein Acr_20g0009410 [Actinidia rufa]|uniref:FBD domain-containing protein n=1 Tax=Actinidia rufa TaxID=165716 RepID=A0A7J0GEA3_9ERIC|nr:hypothetical protein Acr_20g0009410 [Actinidia rufa]